MQHRIQVPNPINIGICGKLRRTPDGVTHLEGWGQYVTSDVAVELGKVQHVAATVAA